MGFEMDAALQYEHLVTDISIDIAENGTSKEIMGRVDEKQLYHYQGLLETPTFGWNLLGCLKSGK